MSDLVFEDLSLDAGTVDSGSTRCSHGEKTTSSAVLYRLAELVFDPVGTSVAPVAIGKACGPRALDGRVGRARPNPRGGKGVND